MSNRDLTVGQLRAMTAHLSDDAPVEVMLSGLLTYADETGSSPNIDGVLVLGCENHLSIEVSIVADDKEVDEDGGEDEEVVDARNNHGQGSETDIDDD